MLRLDDRLLNRVNLRKETRRSPSVFVTLTTSMCRRMVSECGARSRYSADGRSLGELVDERRSRHAISRSRRHESSMIDRLRDRFSARPGGHHAGRRMDEETARARSFLHRKVAKLAGIDRRSKLPSLCAALEGLIS